MTSRRRSETRGDQDRECSMKPIEVLPPKPNVLTELFPVKKPIIGVIHLPPLPGAPRYAGAAMRDIYAAAAADAKTLAGGGIDGIIIENASDMPFGITCVANGVIPALAVAKAVGARWVRANQWVNAYVANEGFLNGPAPEAMRYRARIGAGDVR